ncbi:MAG TPA: GIY-YIG nuclease family protein [Terriglobales bacterium]|nr:GIY-YIG nuclease family protein [Terriglobales bacterium]
MEKTAAPEKSACWHVYMLRCADGTLYTGCAADVARRLAVHNAGHGAKYTRGRLPAVLVYSEACASKAGALRREAAVKKLTRVQKLLLINQ